MSGDNQAVLAFFFGIFVLGVVWILVTLDSYSRREASRPQEVEFCKIHCHPQKSEWLPMTETCLCEARP